MATDLVVIERAFQDVAPQWEPMLRPVGMTAEMVVKSVVISCQRNPRLLDCDRSSLILSGTSLACVGVIADGYTGQGYLIPFNDTRRRTLLAQPAVGYRGYATIAARAAFTINGRVVLEGDEFDFELGTKGFVHHKPKLGGEKERRIIAAWAEASHLHQPSIIDVMSIDQLLETRDKSPSMRGDYAYMSPWKTHFEAMCMKTPRRRLARSMPMGVGPVGQQFALAAAMDEAHEERGLTAYVTPDRGVIVDGQAQQFGGPQPDPGQQDLVGTPKFVIRRSEDESKNTVCQTIAEWRARMIMAIEQLSAEKLEILINWNVDEIKRLEQGFPGDIAAVAAAYKNRTGKEW